MKTAPRPEAEVFADLASLARAPSYIHAIAQICNRDNLVMYSGEMKAADLEKLFRRSRLIRTEITTLLGLLARGPMDLTLPDESTLEEYVGRTDTLMEDLHHSIGSPMLGAMLGAAKDGTAGEALWRGAAMREPIFYGGESAYSFQYRDLAVEKYSADDPWLVQNKGFSIAQAQAIARIMCALLDEKATRLHNATKESGVLPGTWLPTFVLSHREIAYGAGLPMERVQAFLDAFTLRGSNDGFQAVGDFNAVSAFPILRIDEESVALFQTYGIYASLYESPFYWMMADKGYAATASQHRGAFTESFAARRLASVFGTQRVHKNVTLVQNKGKAAGEIDVLVVFGDRLIIVQAKSKMLTLEARRGNDGHLRKDFAGAIQDSYDQAWSCAQALLSGDCELIGADGKPVVLPLEPKEILLFNVVADHYPALAFQARQFLKYQTSTTVLAPFVMDVFLLDTLTEMLETPLRLLSYCKLRVENTERLMLSHELTALGFHLKRNLWVESKFDLVMLEDDIAIDLDLAMTVRRDRVPGQRTPEGILTQLSGTLFEHLIHQIEQQPEPAVLELGLVLLTLGEKSCRAIHHGLEAVTGQTRRDGEIHDFTVGGDYGGITVHCNAVPSDEAVHRLGTHCQVRKYSQRAQRWFGLSVDPNADLQFAVVIDAPWQQSSEMDLVTSKMPESSPAARLVQWSRGLRRRKVGRNDRCPCGSGKKFKRCCLQER